MPALIRQADPGDAARWLELLKACLGEDHPAKQVYETTWVSQQLNPSSNNITIVAEVDGQLHASVTILGPFAKTTNPVLNLGRNLFRPESYNNGAAQALVQRLCEQATVKKQVQIVRVLPSDNAQQILFENAGFGCVGYQPCKHMHRAREGVLFYSNLGRLDLNNRLPLSDSLAQVSELAAVALSNLKLNNAMSVRDGVTGYPLQSELTFHEATFDDFELWRTQAEAANPAKEISGSFNLGYGYMRMTMDAPMKAVLGQRGGTVVAGLAYFLDTLDRSVRVIDSFSTDDLSLGALLQHIVKLSQSQMNAIYVEVDVLTTAPRLLKSAEQMGFVPVAYMPAFYSKDGGYTDVVKMVKLNLSYSPENLPLTANARSVVTIVDNGLQDQRMGVAIINLLRGLPIFEGLGDGELRKISRLFVQKLYRPSEKVFNKGDLGNEAYIIMRGQIDICLEEGAKPLATIGNGQIFGELAFLDGAARVALAVASQASILLVIQRTAFNELVQREPHLGMVVMKNVAMDLSNKLRRANTALSAMKK
jgi:hypothetical protein